MEKYKIKWADKDHVWIDGIQFISLSRFMSVSNELGNMIKTLKDENLSLRNKIKESDIDVSDKISMVCDKICSEISKTLADVTPLFKTTNLGGITPDPNIVSKYIQAANYKNNGQSIENTIKKDILDSKVEKDGLAAKINTIELDPLISQETLEDIFPRKQMIETLTNGGAKYGRNS